MRIYVYLIYLYLFGTKVKSYFQELKFISGEEPYQITIFKDNSSAESKKQYPFFKEITNRNPTVIIDFDKTNEGKYNRSLNMPILKNPRKSTIYIIFGEENIQNSTFSSIYAMIDKFVDMSPTPMRPKCLVVFWNGNNWLEIKKLLLYAWDKKFLDFTVLIKSTSDAYYFINYNPFTKKYATSNSKNTAAIFPDKTHDMNQYPLIMSAFQAEPTLGVEIDKGKVVKVHGVTYGYAEIILEKLNLKPQFILEKNSNELESHRKSLEDLENNRLQMIPAAYLIDTWLYGKKLIIGNTITESKMVMIVPILNHTKFNFSIVMLLYIISFPTIILIFYRTTKILKFKSSKWTILYIYQVVIGMSARPPKKLSEKIIFLLLAILSIIYANIFFATLEDMRVVTDEQDFDSYQEVFESKMTIHSGINANEHDIPEVKKLLHQRTKIKSYKQCVTELIGTRNIICVVSLFTAKYHVSNNLDIQRRPIMKLAGSTFYHQHTAFPYEKASPFAEKFDLIIQYVKEAGLINLQDSKKNITIHSLQTLFSSEMNRDTIIEQLIIISIIGFSGATVLFLWELAYSYFLRF